MTDAFASFRAGLGDPVEHAAAITPDDDADLGNSTRFIWVGGAGNLDVTLVGGERVLIENIAQGTMLALRAQRVHANDTASPPVTSTTATKLVGFW